METVARVSSSEDEFDMDLVRSFPCFEPADYLDSQEDIVGFVNIFLREGDTSMLVHALKTVALAPRTVAQEGAEFSREALLAALEAESSPRLDTIMRVMKSLGLRLVVENIGAASDPALSSETPHEV